MSEEIDDHFRALTSPQISAEVVCKRLDSLFNTTFTIHDVTHVNELVCANFKIRVGKSFLFWFCDELVWFKMATVQKAWSSPQKMIVKIDLTLFTKTPWQQMLTAKFNYKGEIY